MADYATVQDVIALKRPLSAAEQARAAALIPLISDAIRYEAQKVGKDFDKMLYRPCGDYVNKNQALASVAKAVVADVVMRELNTPAGQLPATQYSEAAGGVSQSYSIPNSSGRIALWPSDLKALGIKRQKIGSISMMTEW